MLGAAHKQPHTKRKRATTSLDCLEKKAAKTDEKAPWYHCYTKGDVSYNRYMENEWGKPTFDDKKLFESLTLEGAQAGLSWATILVKREAYRRAFHNFDSQRVAEMTSSDVDRFR